MTIQTLMINQIIVDHGLQTREAIHDVTVKEYQEAIETMADLPPVTVFHDGNDYRLADGFHRLQAHKNLGRDRISARVISGSRRDAFLHALAANAEHGLRRSQSDKRRAVQMALNDQEMGTKSDRELAKACKVSHTFVATVRSAAQPKENKEPTRSAVSNWPKSDSQVATLPHDMTDKDISYEAYTDLDEAIDTNKALVEEIERLNDRLAIESLNATEEEKSHAAETINNLRSDLKLITIERDSLKNSRNSYQNENAELKRQCAKYLAVIKKLNQQIASLQDELSLYRAMGGTGSQSSQPQTHPTGTPAF